MPEADEFADSTDWLSTPLNALAPLESSLRCQVCKDFFTTPMITSCSHTFCSLCIRRYLSQEGRCPACRESDQEVKLRRNWVLEELVANFTASRKGLLEFARSAGAGAAMRSEDDKDDTEAQRPKKRRKVEDHVPNAMERRSTRSHTKRIASGTDQQPGRPSTPEVIEDSEEGSEYEDMESTSYSPHFANGTHQEPNDGLVACPCCHRRMKENLINAHLDKCIMGDSHTPVDDTSSPAPQIAPPGTIAYTQRKPSTQNDRLPFINYSLLTDNALRKKLRDLGIPNHGSKELMRRRHTEWVNLWNANCDSRNPVSKRQLLQELRVWEDTLGRQSDKTGTSGFMAKDFDRDHHVKIQKSNFDDLIKQAREKRAVASSKPPPTTEEGTIISPEQGDPASQVQESSKPSHLQNGGSVTEQHFGGSGTTASPSIPPSSAIAAAVAVGAVDQKDREEHPRLVPVEESSKDIVLRSPAEVDPNGTTFHARPS